MTIVITEKVLILKKKKAKSEIAIKRLSQYFPLFFTVR